MPMTLEEVRCAHRHFLPTSEIDSVFVREACLIVHVLNNVRGDVFSIVVLYWWLDTLWEVQFFVLCCR